MKNRICEALKELGIKEVMLIATTEDEIAIEFGGNFNGSDERVTLTNDDFSEEGLK